MDARMDAKILTTGKDLVVVPAEVEILPAITTIEPPAIIQTAGPNVAGGPRFDRRGGERGLSRFSTWVSSLQGLILGVSPLRQP